MRDSYISKFQTCPLGRICHECEESRQIWAVKVQQMTTGAPLILVSVDITKNPYFCVLFYLTLIKFKFTAKFLN